MAAADNSHCNSDNLQLNGKQVTWSMQLYSVVVVHRYTGVQSAVLKSETQFGQKATSLIPTLSDNKAAITITIQRHILRQWQTQSSNIKTEHIVATQYDNIRCC